MRGAESSSGYVKSCEEQWGFFLVFLHTRIDDDGGGGGGSHQYIYKK